MSDTNENYWAEYTGLQHAKHQLLSKYLGGWFPILASANGRVIYIDCHAGRGRHTTGHEGSPILALQILLNHQSRNRILNGTDLHFVFFENDDLNYEYLGDEITALGDIPKNVHIHRFESDYEAALREIVDDLWQRGERLAPSFVFVDPYGFKLSMDLLNSLLRFRGCELLINLMYRYINMATTRPEHSSNMDALFGCHDWHELSSIKNPEDRQYEIISLFSHQLQAKFVTHMNMIGDTNGLKYVLLHASNHAKGRKLMKDSMWAVSPDGSFSAYQRANPDQLVIIEPKPNLGPLKDSLWTVFAGKQLRMEKIYEWLLGELYLEKHVHEVLREYRKQEFIKCSDYGTRFAFSNNPLVSFPSERPAGS